MRPQLHLPALDLSVSDVLRPEKPEGLLTPYTAMMLIENDQ